MTPAQRKEDENLISMILEDRRDKRGEKENETAAQRKAEWNRHVAEIAENYEANKRTREQAFKHVAHQTSVAPHHDRHIENCRIFLEDVFSGAGITIIRFDDRNTIEGYAGTLQLRIPGKRNWREVGLKEKKKVIFSEDDSDTFSYTILSSIFVTVSHGKLDIILSENDPWITHLELLDRKFESTIQDELKELRNYLAPKPPKAVLDRINRQSSSPHQPA